MKTMLTMLFVCLLLTGPASACNLGMHEWERALMIDFALPGPIFPAAEINIISDRFSPHDIKTFNWTADSFANLFWVFLTRKLTTESWPTAQAWLFTPSHELDNCCG